MRAFLGKLLATAVVILVAWHALGQLDAQQPIIDAWNDTRTGGTSVQVDNPLGDLDPDTALEQLDGITVTTPADVDYDRVGQFGKSWVFDFDTNGCDTRNDILARDLTNPTLDDDNCTVLAGVLHDPYTGDTIDFRRGPDTSHMVQIDHIVPLSLAARTGALDWDQNTRLAFANDPMNLIAVDGPTNGSKGDQGPGDWLPPNAAFHCDYVAAFVQVVDAYDLAMTPQDVQVAQSVLAEC